MFSLAKWDIEKLVATNAVANNDTHISVLLGTLLLAGSLKYFRASAAPNTTSTDDPTMNAACHTSPIRTHAWLPADMGWSSAQPNS